MNGFFQRSTQLSLIALTLHQAPAVFAWGHLGHQTLAAVGSQLAGQKATFWAANAGNMGSLSNVPDVNWKSGKGAVQEKPTHWFEPDGYFQSSSDFHRISRSYDSLVGQYSEDKVITNGTAPWRIKQFYDLAVEAFKAGDYDTGIEMAGVMSHYIGDLSQPLHVTTNYDGQESGNKGIHKFFESDNLESDDARALMQEVSDQARALLNDPAYVASFRGPLIEAIFKEIDRAYAFKDQVIKIDSEQGRSGRGAQAMLAIAKARMADGAATLAIILAQISKDAGLDVNGRSVSVSIPRWVAPEYSNTRPLAQNTEEFVAFLQQDDCEH